MSQVFDGNRRLQVGQGSSTAEAKAEAEALRPVKIDYRLHFGTKAEAHDLRHGGRLAAGLKLYWMCQVCEPQDPLSVRACLQDANDPSSTMTRLRHLKRFHAHLLPHHALPPPFKKHKLANGQTQDIVAADTSIDRAAKTIFEPFTQARFEEALCDFFIAQRLPATFIELPEIQTLFETLHSGPVKLPAADTLHEWLSKRKNNSRLSKSTRDAS